jgi:hypothetical protein
VGVELSIPFKGRLLDAVQALAKNVVWMLLQLETLVPLSAQVENLVTQSYDGVASAAGATAVTVTLVVVIRVVLVV